MRNLGIVNNKAKLIKKDTPPTTTATQCRANFFLPFIRSKFNGGKREFTARINGKDYIIKEIAGVFLTESHKDIIDAIILAAHKAQRDKSGFQVLFSLNAVYNILARRISKSVLKEKIQEIASAKFFIQNPDNPFLFNSFSIFSRAKTSFVKNENIVLSRGLGIEDYYYFIEISDDYLNFENFDIQIFIKKEINREIINLKSAVIKHLVRYVLSHNELNKDLNEILIETGIIDEKTSRKEKSKKRKEIIAAKNLLLEKFSIDIKLMDNGKYGVFYKKIKQVYFKNPNIILLDFKPQDKNEMLP